MDLRQYKTLVFDCDGVILDSNQLKIEAYFDTAIRFGADATHAQALVDYHILLGGISRFVKFEYFLREILHRPVTQEDTEQLLAMFSEEVLKRLMTCTIAPGLFELRQRYPDSRWMVISGGDQQELQVILQKRELAALFNVGIYGSPDNKDTVLAREKANGNLHLPAIFFGDSRYDHEASTRAGLDFIFMSAWTDFKGWQQYCAQHSITVLNAIADL